MVYEINDPTRGSLFGRIGRGLAQGVAEQLPKETSQYRLASGLRDFERDSANLSPMQQITRLASIPQALEHPQLIDTMGRLAQQQQSRNAYTRGGNKAGISGVDEYGQTPQMQPGQAEKTLQGVNFLNIPPGQQGQQKTQSQQQTEFVQPKEVGQPQVIETNPLRSEAIPRKPWTPERYNQEVGDILDSGQTVDINEARAIAKENEARELAQPEGEQAKDKYLQDRSDQIKEAAIKKMELLTHKKGDELFQDITGEMQNNFIRTIEKDLRRNPKLTIEDAINKRANDLLQIPKEKSNINTIASRNFFDKISPNARTKNLKNLLNSSKIFASVGNNEELFNILQKEDKPAIPATPGTPGTPGMGLSPEGAAWIAYPRSKPIENITNSIKPKTIANQEKRSLEYAQKIADNIQDADSLLSISREISNKDPYFVKSIFFDYFDQHQDELRLNKFQKGELGKRPNELSARPTWGDVALFPFFGG